MNDINGYFRTLASRERDRFLKAAAPWSKLGRFDHACHPMVPFPDWRDSLPETARTHASGCSFRTRFGGNR